MNTEEKKQKFVEQLSKKGWNVTATCKAVRISRKTFYEWCKRDEEFNSLIKDAREEFGDFVEESLYKRIKAGDTTAIIFALKTKFKDRGWTEKTETQIDLTTGAKPIRYIDVMPHTEIDKDGRERECIPE